MILKKDIDYYSYKNDLGEEIKKIIKYFDINIFFKKKMINVLHKALIGINF